MSDWHISPKPESPPSLRLHPQLLERRLLLERLKGKEAPEPTWFSRLSRRVAIEAFLRAGLRISLLHQRGYANFKNVQVERNTVKLKRLPDAFEGFKILQLSDLHLDLDEPLVAVLSALLKDIDYDLCIITGDFRNLCHGPHARAVELTSQIVQSLPGPVLSVLGNHDPVALADDLEPAGMRFLMNEHMFLERAGAKICVAGVDDAYYYRTDNLGHALKGVDSGLCTLLLSHAPINVDEAAQAGVDWMVGGHTHAGQICLPGSVPVIVHGNVPKACRKGAWTWGPMQGYTSRGTGSCGVAVRFNCPPEITLHTLISDR